MDDEELNIASAENVMFPLIAVLGLLANAFVISVIVVSEKSRTNRTVANTFVLNLAIADILFLIALPFYTPSLHVNGYPYSAGMCKLLEAMKHISYHSSILFLTGMSIDRYVAIVHSLRSLEYRTQRNARIACAVLWMISLVVSTPIIAFSSLDIWVSNITENNIGTCRQMFPGYETKYASETDLLNEFDPGMYPVYDISGEGNNSSHGDYEYGNETFDYYYTAPNGTQLASFSGKEKVCVDRGHENSTAFRAWQWITFSVFFVIPVLVVLFCYFKIWQATAIRKVRSQRAEGNQEQQNLQSPTPPKQSWKQIQSKVTIMVAILVSAFIICWMPFQIWIVLTLAPGVKVSYAHQCGVINATVTILAWSNSVLNPILYSITSEHFRKRALTTLFYLRYGYRRTMRMSVTRTSRTGLNLKTDMTVLNSIPPTSSPKNNRRFDTQMSPPLTPKDDVGQKIAF